MSAFLTKLVLLLAIVIFIGAAINALMDADAKASGNDTDDTWGDDGSVF